MEISKELKSINKDDLLVSYDLNSLYLTVQIDVNITWPKIETNYPFKKYMSEAVFSLFNSGRWNELNTSAFLTVKYHNPKNLVCQQLPINEKVNNLYKNNRL